LIRLYHCADARSFRPLWALEELGLEYELTVMPFPPRYRAKEFMAVNPLGTIPAMVDDETFMTESAAIVGYLVTRYGPSPLAVGVGVGAGGAMTGAVAAELTSTSMASIVVLAVTMSRNPTSAATGV